MFDIPIPFCHNLYLSATLKQFLTEFAARYNLLHHVYMSIPGRTPTCDLIARLFSCSRRDIGGDEDAVLSFCWYFPNLNLQHITSEINPLQLCIIPGNIKNTLNSTKLNEIKRIYHTVGTVPKSNGKIIERCKIDAYDIHIHDHLLSYIGTVISIKLSATI
jgi:hypothetical protein